MPKKPMTKSQIVAHFAGSNPDSGDGLIGIRQGRSSLSGESPAQNNRLGK